jgi:hypothetical protein
MSIIPAFLQRVLGAFAPGTGKRRAGIRLAELAPTHRPDVSRTTVAPSPPVPRSPYGLDTPLDGADSLLVRPCLIAVERARQPRRRITLVLATGFGIDLDPDVVGGAR